MRVLVTGSREWTDRETIVRALTYFAERTNVTLVTGGARGADNLCRDVGLDLGWFPEEHVVYKKEWDRLGPKAGMLRNQRMVDRGADVCIGFPLPDSRGTWDCMERAHNAGIQVIRVLPSQMHEKAGTIWFTWTPEVGREF